MKFDFWTDLPKALCNIIEECLTQEEKKYHSLIINSNEVYNFYLICRALTEFMLH